MKTIDASIIYDAVYELVFSANYKLPKDVYSKLFSAFENETNPVSKEKLGLILQNAYVAYKSKRPLCQDSGQVLVFVRLGQNIHVEGGCFETIINKAVADCYREKGLRKSVVCDALFDRTNTKDNTPAIIYTKIVAGEEFSINVLIKGAGAENMSRVKMFTPTSTKEDVVQFILATLVDAGTNPCPPLFLGLGAGGTMEQAALLSKQVLLEKEPKNAETEQDFKQYLNSKLSFLGFIEPVLDISIKTSSTHIASLPAALTVCCHSNRHAACSIDENGFIVIGEFAEPKALSDADCPECKRVHTDDVEVLRSLKQGERILLSGTIYTARDAAHKRMAEILAAKTELPFELKDKIIFYAGPAPVVDNEVIGPFGPTTAYRMDKYAVDLYNRGLLGTIGKGERGNEVSSEIKNNRALYFSAIGGIACLLAQKVVASEVVAFDDLLSEAVHRLEVEDLPLTVEISSTDET